MTGLVAVTRFVVRVDAVVKQHFLNNAVVGSVRTTQAVRRTQVLGGAEGKQQHENSKENQHLGTEVSVVTEIYMSCGRDFVTEL